MRDLQGLMLGFTVCCTTDYDFRRCRRLSSIVRPAPAEGPAAVLVVEAIALSLALPDSVLALHELWSLRGAAGGRGEAVGRRWRAGDRRKPAGRRRRASTELELRVRVSIRRK